MARYRTEFYEPLVADYANFGTWTEAGEQDATQRATALWQEILGKEPVQYGRDRQDALRSYIEARTAAGGAAPVS